MKTTIPATKMDLRNTDSAELFADDGGFKLIQETTRDGALITAAKEAKEAAAAAAAAAQLSFSDSAAIGARNRKLMFGDNDEAFPDAAEWSAWVD